MTKKYLIANFFIEICFDGDKVLEERLSAYETAFEDAPDIKINVTNTSEDIDVRMDNLIKLSDIIYFYKTEDKDVIFYYDPNLAKTIGKVGFSKDYRDIDIVLYNLGENHNVEDHMLLYNIIGNAMFYIMQMNNGFVFHSSSICYDGYGVAFSAKSGTGKSTHTSLWLKNYPGSFILNDDTPIITRGGDGKFYLCGTPWAGTTGINQNYVVPLKAIVFLERDKENSISYLSAPEAMNPFFEGIRSPITDDMFAKTLNTLNELFTKVPLCRLKCNMDSEAAVVAKEFIFKNK